MMRRIDRIDRRGNITEHLRRSDDTRRTVCGLGLGGNTQDPSGARECSRCVALHARQAERVPAADRLQRGQRVTVRRAMAAVGSHAGSGIDLVPPRAGTVQRELLTDASAWVELDERMSGDGEAAHGFGADAGRRARHVLTWPDWCDSADPEVGSSRQEERVPAWSAADVAALVEIQRRGGR